MSLNSTVDVSLLTLVLRQAVLYAPCGGKNNPFDAIPSLLFAAICVQLWVLLQPSKCIFDPMRTKFTSR